MLQIRNSEPLARFSDTRSTAMSPSDLLASVNSLARRRFGVIVLIFSLSVVCGAIYLFTAAPKFLAQSSILIDTRKAQLFQQQSVVGDATIDSAAVDSQIEVLKSEAIAASVVKELHLTSDPEFVGSKPGIFGILPGISGGDRAFDGSGSPATSTGRLSCRDFTQARRLNLCY